MIRHSYTSQGDYVQSVPQLFSERGGVSPPVLLRSPTQQYSAYARGTGGLTPPRSENGGGGQSSRLWDIQNYKRVRGIDAAVNFDNEGHHNPASGC